MTLANIAINTNTPNIISAFKIKHSHSLAKKSQRIDNF